MLSNRHMLLNNTHEQELCSKTEFIPINDDDTVPDTDSEMSDNENEEGNEKENESDNNFSCPVCYTDGKESGLVNPSCCSHKICLQCYTNIAIRSNSACCPMCRTKYLNNETVQEANTQQIDNTNILRPLSPNIFRRPNYQMNSTAIQQVLNNIILPDLRYLDEMMDIMEEYV